MNKYFFIPAHARLYLELPVDAGSTYRYDFKSKPRVGFVLGEKKSRGILFKRVLLRDGVFWVHHKNVREAIKKGGQDDKVS